ncbi:MAG: orotidine-5'-phosphate decarboxylase [Oligoflexia bacterium]|nr:orotidine-5'-phosphate decarboxylase [Oligoflexia bacterium]
MLNPIIVPLDVDSPSKADEIIQCLKGKVGGFKIGPRLSLRVDSAFMQRLKSLGIVFFDHKFFDIPSTTLASVRVAFELGADWVTVHALNGEACLRELAQFEKQAQKENKNFKILVVTILTSFEQKTLPSIIKDQSIQMLVQELATLSLKCGLNSFVCSPHEIQSIKKISPNAFIVTPGIRLDSKTSDDQTRTATPKEAIQKGASALVIGRPIIEAKNHQEVVEKILESL